MRVRLELLDGPQSGSARMTDLVRAYTIGTDAGVSWQLPGDTTQHASVTLYRGASGVDMEATGEIAIEGHAINEGQRRAVGHGSQITIAGQTIRISYEQAQLSMESLAENAPPSISSILSDVTPGGGSAAGPLPGRVGEDFLTRERITPRKANFRHIQETKAFDAPPSPFEDGIAKHLPDDWDAPGELADRSAQSSEPTAQTILTQNQPIPTEMPPNVAATPDHTLLQAAGVLPQEVQTTHEQQLQNAGTALRQLMDGIGALEDALLKHCHDLGVKPTPTSEAERYAFYPAAILSDQGGNAMRAMTVRIQSILSLQHAICNGSRAVIAKARDQLDPDAIATDKMSRSGFFHRLTPNAAAWAEYCARFHPEALPNPLSEAALAKEIQDQLRKPEGAQEK